MVAVAGRESATEVKGALVDDHPCRRACQAKLHATLMRVVEDPV
jgi:hypothetical protein